MEIPAPEVIDALVRAGGWAFAALVLAGIVLAIASGRLVPRFVYDREVEGRTKAETAATRQTEALDRMTEAFEKLSQEVRWQGQPPVARSRR